MAILVTGGSGYIGSVVVDVLRERGETVIVADDLVRGHREAVDPDVPVHVGDLTDRTFVESVFAAQEIDAILHFAAWSQVGESMLEPGKYFRNNYGAVLTLLEVASSHRCRTVIFSSSAATYGDPTETPIPESAPTLPTNPYGESKLQCERLLRWFAERYDFRWSALRYFNAAGASARRGEDHSPETHLIPLAIAAALPGSALLKVFGTDYPTPDGTCIRDYIHIEDLADAHLLALDRLRLGRGGVFNLGNGVGFSVKEVIEAVSEVAGTRVRWEPAARRSGDPPSLVASSDLARGSLGWRPSRYELRMIVESAWRWHESHRGGYGGV